VSCGFAVYLCICGFSSRLADLVDTCAFRLVCLQKEEAINLVHHAVLAGIFNDLGSGSNVDLCVITKDGAEMKRTFDEANPRKVRSARDYQFPRGSTSMCARLSHVDLL
jgi:hypothetical protein